MKKNIKKMIVTVVFTGTALVSLSGCGFFGGSGEGSKPEETSETVEAVEDQEAMENNETVESTEAVKIQGLEFDHEIAIEKAEHFNIDVYKDGYYVLKTHKGKAFHQLLIVPEGKEAPEGLDDSVIVVKQPVTSSKIDSMTLVDLLGNINADLFDKLSLVTAKRDKVYIERLAENMDKGITQSAGSAASTDVELLKTVNPQVYLCNPDLEKEDVYEKIKAAGIHPFITYLHSENDTFGRLEWVKALGVIYGDLASAEKFYQEQKTITEGIDKSIAGEKTFAMFCLNKKKNKAYVRRTGDTIAKIGEIAGGKNMLSDVNKGSWEEMSMDDFISKYKDTDFLIYMDKHGDSIGTIEELKGISEAISDFKAVKDNNVWRTRTDFYQMNKYGNMAKELNGIFAGDSAVIGSTTEFVHLD